MCSKCQSVSMPFIGEQPVPVLGLRSHPSVLLCIHIIQEEPKRIWVPPAPCGVPGPMLTPKHVLLVLSCADQPTDAFDALAFRFHIFVLSFLGQKHHWEEKSPAVDSLLLQGQAGQSPSSRQDGRTVAMGTWLAPAHLGFSFLL